MAKPTPPPNTLNKLLEERRNKTTSGDGGTTKLKLSKLKMQKLKSSSKILRL